VLIRCGRQGQINADGLDIPMMEETKWRF